MKNKNNLALLLLALSVSVTSASATELIYTPVNPSFGGSPLNGNWLKASADAQNKLKEKQEIIEKDPLEEFQKSLDRRVLSALANRIVDQAFGSYDSELQTGRYEFGDYTFEINANVGENINVVITDGNSGSSTTIEVPYYQ